ncbi:MAG: cupin domain-containing protein [Candidatus Micrarchaeota archaeon]|nr:cupin domain-containing protein [Candidatus Micrarchaeota archaeon]
MHIIPANKSGSLGKGEKIKGGCVCLTPGKSVGEHTTGDGEEIILVLEGEAAVITGGEKQVLKKDESLFIKENTVHNVTNEGAVNLVYVYFVGGKK